MTIVDMTDRFYRQLRHGCQNRLCSTPTCMSCRKRRTEGPFRRFTVLTARALATFLAGESDAMQRLCPHSPVVDSDPDDCAFPTDRLTNSPLVSEVFTIHGQRIYDRLLGADISQPSGGAISVTDDSDQILRVVDTTLGMINAPNVVRLQESLSTLTNETGERQVLPSFESSSQSGASLARKRSRPEKDLKSFTQNLYDTEIFKASEIVEIRNGSYRISLPEKIGETDGHRSEWRSHTNQQFRKLVDAELLTHPLLTTSWEEVGDIFLSERNIRHNPDVEYMKDLMAAQVVMKAFSSLTCHLPLVSRQLRAASWELFVSLRRLGQFVPNGKSDRCLVEPVLQLMDSYDDEIASRLMVRLARAFASRRCWSLASTCSFGENADTLGKNTQFPVFVNHIIDSICVVEMNRGETMGDTETASDSVPYMEDMAKTWDTGQASSTWKVEPVRCASKILEWLRSVIIHEWDGRAEFQRFGAVGGAVDLMACFCMLLSCKSLSQRTNAYSTHSRTAE